MSDLNPVYPGLVSLQLPLTAADVRELEIGDRVLLSGPMLCGRDSALPELVRMIQKDEWDVSGMPLAGMGIFHSAVSPAGVGPTSSNKAAIEKSIPELSAAGIRLHLGKGRLKPETVAALDRYGSVYAVMPPVTALLRVRTLRKKVLAFPELGMEALYLIDVDRYPAVIAAAHGRSLYDEDI